MSIHLPPILFGRTGSGSGSNPDRVRPTNVGAPLLVGSGVKGRKRTFAAYKKTVTFCKLPNTLSRHPDR